RRHGATRTRDPSQRLAAGHHVRPVSADIVVSNDAGRWAMSRPWACATAGSTLHLRLPLALVITLIFVAGLLCRLIIFATPHGEGDEIIFASLAQQLLEGKGYTLRGHPLLTAGRISAANYDHALFFHPPAGIGLFLLLYLLFGITGFALVELLSYAV